MPDPNYTISLLIVGEGLSAVADQLVQASVPKISFMAINELAATTFPTHEIDCVLFDGRKGADWIISQIRVAQSFAPDCKLLVCMPNSTQDAITYLQLGISGLLALDQTADELIAVLERVVDGHFYLNQEIAQCLAMRQIKKILAPFNALTSREYDVFCMLAEGFTLQAMADQLNVSSKTVSNCQSQIKAKLGLETRDSIIEFAKNYGLLN